MQGGMFLFRDGAALASALQRTLKYVSLVHVTLISTCTNCISGIRVDILQQANYNNVSKDHRTVQSGT